MALGIPLPGQPGDALLKGVDTGTSMFSRMMNPILQREQMAQQWKQHMNNLAIQQEQQERLNQLLPYQIQQYENQAAMHPAEMQYKQALYQKAMAEANQLNYLQNMLSGFSGVGQIQDGGMTPNSIPGMTPGIMPGQTNQGAPIPLMQGQQPGNNPFFGMNAIQAGAFKKLTGIDPWAESPQVKSQRDFEDFSRKENFKENRNKEALSPANITKFQNMVSGTDNLIPIIDDLISKIKDLDVGIGTISPDKRASINSLVTSAMEHMLNSYGWSSTDSNKNAVLKIMDRGIGESQKNWLSRLEHEKKESIKRRNYGANILKTGRLDASPIHGKITLTDEDAK